MKSKTHHAKVHSISTRIPFDQFITTPRRAWVWGSLPGDRAYISVTALSRPQPVNATFCMRCVQTWQSAPLGQLLWKYPQCFPNQIKCIYCSTGRIVGRFTEIDLTRTHIKRVPQFRSSHRHLSTRHPLPRHEGPAPFVR